MLKLKQLRSSCLMLFCAVSAACCLQTSQASDLLGNLSSSFDTGIELPDLSSKQLHHIRADKWRMSGETLFVSGNVHIPYGNSIIRADSAMIDTESNDIEAKGNVQLTSVKRTPQTVTIEELDRLLNNPRVAIEYLDVIVDPLGTRKIKINVVSRGGSIVAERLSGNLVSGMMTFTNLQLQAGTFTCKAQRGVRQPGGELKLEEAEFSSCVYLREDQEHFSFALKTADLYPHERNGYGFANVEKEHSEYSIWGYNTLVRIYDVPILWLPLFYAPKDESPQLFQTQLGKSSHWGFYGLFSKQFDLLEYPRTSVVLDLDWYSLRGMGYGMHGKSMTENSFTDYVIYSIYDKRPYESSSDKPWRKDSTARLNIPNERFDIRVTHMTHLTPRLDFRAQAEWMSDAFMLSDYFSSRAYSIDQPASYGALEYQGDRYSAALYTRFRLNDFYTAVQKLPEGRLDVPRQEIFAGSNLYFQGSMSAAYMRMNWAEFDRPLKNPNGKLRDYESSRFDSVNFLYYPIRTRYINIVPRAGLRFTGYSNTSRTKITEGDLNRMQVASNIDRDYGVAVKNYDDLGDAKLRVVAEVGVEANTKIYRSWQNIRNAFWGFDGLRHVCEPYINYTYITDPTVDRENLLFFDDVDRIREMNFVRMGLRNRLQTRRGTFRNSTVHQWLSMDNYWDIYFNDDKDFNQIGDFCTKLTFAPVKELTFTGFVSIDAGHNQDHKVHSTRGGRDAGRPVISGDLLNRLYFSVQYKPIDDMTFFLSYDYRDGYQGRSAYSMGSTFTEIDSGSAFDRYYTFDRTQTLTFGMGIPLTPDRKTQWAYTISYDFEEGGFTRQTLTISRVLHCVKITGEVEFERNRDGDYNSVEYETSYSVYATLVGMEGPMDSVRRNTVSQLTGE